MTAYRDNPDAVRALVKDDRVHRDLYTSPEIFALEQEHFFGNTWNYVGHESQIPKSGDWISNDIGGRPLIIVRHGDGSVRALMNRCAHKGSRLVNGPCGNTGKFFRCPYHAWTFKTDGALLAIPLKNGYEGTALGECEASRGLTALRHVRSHRGFIFVKINDAGPDFETFFGDSLSSIDNMADRSPEGELEIAGGCLRFVHQCNWKMFVENLNDTMHPMVAHESSAGTAKAMWAGQPADAPKPMAIEQFVPFMSDYKFFEDMGIRTYDNGHSFTGVHFSIHSKYAAIPAYDDAMKARYGEEKTAQILGMARHNTVYYPNLTIKGAIQAIRVVKPLAVDRTLVESWTFRLKGAPPELLQRTTMYSRLINSPFSVVGHDDLQAYRGMQAGLLASGNEWVSLHRNFDATEVAGGEITTIGTSELPMRNQYRAWSRYMTETM
ncbi:aromatic ring-hydroxylating dioxygenase subunit alpha [Variovorax ginsengisoli]|uniref:Phenylpropionate dioxygenase-like ring-hydroxylating dioxygenase large terminal subunit n=1 Tax=Variovorax ginsengisoli TaxID=363844 RepID=A0ABT9S3L5_9BURK|nr:aromatic ring-hydroxylating dioxygenase subunit alpha [Variovorax ginsengisoli]MDP9898929.1 phenylpropionate dioxygenase-like ring-hydroxylating dioxygenase large terminal subunit [Variovorax ginsengisoli]